MLSENELTESQLGSVDELRSRFFHACEDSSFASEFDERDLERFGYDDWWVYNFFLLGRSKVDMALQKITNSLRWRKQFGVNDITEESFSIETHQKGAVYPHGRDKEGRTILWFDVKLHNKKIPGNTELAKRYLVYWLEKLQRQYPSQRITVLEDMSAAGVSNMDLEVVKFKIRCFEEYFPFLVDMLFIYEMAWILNAIWKIVEKILSEEAKSHIKFIRKGDVKTYIEGTTLPSHMGGTDNFKWVYTPKSTEEEEFQSILYSEDMQELDVTDSDRNTIQTDPLTNERHSAEPLTNGMDSSELPTNVIDHTLSTNNKSRNQETPTLGGAPEENCTIHSPPANDMQNQSPTKRTSSSLSANTHNVVNDDFQVATPLASDQSQQNVKQKIRLKNGIIQERPKKVQFVESEAEELKRKQVDGRNKNLRLLRRVRTKDSHVGPLLTIIPGEQLEFSFDSTKTDESTSELYSRITLQNTTVNTVAYKVKTTSPDMYKVKPSAGPIKPNANVNISVYISAAHKQTIAKDKFLVLSTKLHEVIKTPAEMTEFWKRVAKEDAIEHRLKCTYVPTEEERERMPDDSNAVLSKQISQLNEKISILTDLTAKQHDAMQYKFNIVLVLLLLALLVAVYLFMRLSTDGSMLEDHACPGHNHMYSTSPTTS
ncbi:motile sperm domain-containing protein 2-like [Anneissia japonica]|uniref:motile sperm domain-containing protein 2-like n=1 Tax=Anneissia japonica TaxID=1529436 RepID=UPI0014259E65|nr:motile sperm domain-containing protein 2-like [Anneissia japonica]